MHEGDDLWQDSDKMGSNAKFPKLHMLTDMPGPNNKEQLQWILDIIIYLGISSTSSVEICKPFKDPHPQ